MKKLILTTFVAILGVSMLSSCGKDEKENELSLSGTSWKGAVAQNANQINVEASCVVAFSSETAGTFTEVVQASAFGNEIINDDFSEPCTYTFDGKSSGVITVVSPTGTTMTFPFTYSTTDQTITLDISKQYPQAATIGISSIVLNKQ